ncbi:hypothetical protein G7Y89_g6747 [Cudoniella acicularis]|uniref:Uncharacterized protein n=1 Tax=Cudoniella acicularis TaxID=354080 RepID=A0A8H4RJW9_9HELO|nr:hypothetical protein G7Y89_g6747 [Cudoniella acicularis]
MDIEDDVFNSSDIEFDAPPPNPFAGAGKASIEAIIEHALTDRIDSKKFSKQLTFTKGRPGTQYRNALWYNRFQSFRVSALRVSTTSNPDGEQIERFLRSIVSKVEPKVLSVPSYDWLKGGFRHLILALVFHHAEFKLSSHESARIATCMQQLVKDGILTRVPSQEKNWIGAYILRKIVTAILHNALNEGTLCWDITLFRIATIVLTAALSARSGDICTDPTDDQPLPYLSYQDITMKFHGGDKIEDLVASVVIRNEKSKKHNPHSNRNPKLYCQKDTASNLMCPIKLILILALRSGNIAGAESIEKALELARARKSKTIVWAHPERPLACAFVKRGVALLPEKVAHRNQISVTLAEGGMVAGVIASLTSRALRYGAARDVANLPGNIKGTATRAVADELGHSTEAFNKGITATYVGARSIDTWTPRLENDFQDPFGPQISETTPLLGKRKRHSEAEITQLCQEQGLDPSDKKARARASYADKKKTKKEWMSDALNRINNPEDDNPVDEVPAESTFDAALNNGQAVHEAANLEKILLASTDAAMTDTVEDAVFNQIVSPVSDAASSYSQLDFLKRFSTINISNNQSLMRRERQNQEVLARITGNSRDELTFFKYACKNASLGCVYENKSRWNVSSHESTCRKGMDMNQSI